MAAPLPRPTSLRAEPASRSSCPRWGSRSRRGTMPKLLIIDDEESVRYSFRYVFEDEVQVLTAGTGAEGMAVFEEQDPEVVVLDLQLPDFSGLEVFRRIQAMDPKRPVIFITA